jgi:transposase
MVRKAPQRTSNGAASVDALPSSLDFPGFGGQIDKQKRRIGQPINPWQVKQMQDRRVYSAEFKRKAVQEYYATKRTQGAIEKELGIGAGCLCRWIQEMKAAPQEAFPGHGHLPASAAEEAALQRRLQVAEEENEILRKALLLVAQSPRGAI